MRDHIRILAILHIVFGAMGVVGALIVLLVFGGSRRRSRHCRRHRPIPTAPREWL